MTHRILLADDERVNRILTEQMLETLGYEVVSVNDGAEAAEAVATGEFAAIVMDCQMPRMDGFSATAEIRRYEAASGCDRIPIIGLSARSMEGDSDTAVDKGMDAYLTKPVKVEDLRATLERWIGSNACGSTDETEVGLDE